MDIWTIITIAATFLGTILLLFLCALPFIMLYSMYLKRNPIDFTILVMFKDKSAVSLQERGRLVTDKNGTYYVTAKFMMPFSVKRNLGSKIKSEHMIPNATKKTVCCFVAIKDQIPTPLSLKKAKHLNAENIKMDDIPESFSLTPNLNEMGDFYLSVLENTESLYQKDKDFIQRLAAVAGVSVLIICVLAVVVILILMITLAPDFIVQYTTPQVVELPEI